MEKKIVRARIRDQKDKDLRDALSKIPIYYDESDIVREALRQFLFGHKGRKPQILAADIMEDKEVEDVNRYNDEIVLKQIDISDEELESNLDGSLGI